MNTLLGRSPFVLVCVLLHFSCTAHAQSTARSSPDPVDVLRSHLSHGLGESLFDSELVRDPTMAALVVAARKPATATELRRAAPRANSLEQRLVALEKAGLLRRQGNRWRAAVPILLGREKEKYDRMLFAAARRIDKDLRPAVQELLAELRRRNWQEWSYFFVWSGVFDSQFIWAEMIERKLAPPLAPLIAWVVYPAHEFKSGTNYYPDDELRDQFLAVSWTPRGARTIERVGGAWRTILPAALAGVPANDAGAGQLRELGLMDGQGRVRVPVVRRQDPLYEQLRQLAHTYVQLLVRHMPIQKAEALVGFPRNYVWAMAYHDLSWELLRRLSRDGLLARPEALRPGEPTRVVSMAGTCAVVDVHPPFRKLIEAALTGQ